MAEAGMESFRESYHKFTGMLHCVHKCNAYEWQPPLNWPDADWHLGLTKDSEVFDAKSSHEKAMERLMKRAQRKIK